MTNPVDLVTPELEAAAAGFDPGEMAKVAIRCLREQRPCVFDGDPADSDAVSVLTIIKETLSRLLHDEQRALARSNHAGVRETHFTAIMALVALRNGLRDGGLDV
jgi:hypothetical protein